MRRTYARTPTDHISVAREIGSYESTSGAENETTYHVIAIKLLQNLSVDLTFHSLYIDLNLILPGFCLDCIQIEIDIDPMLYLNNIYNIEL